MPDEGAFNLCDLDIVFVIYRCDEAGRVDLCYLREDGGDEYFGWYFES